MEENKIILNSPYDFRRSSRIALEGRWKKATAACIISVLVLYVPAALWNVATDSIYLGGAEITAGLFDAIYSFIMMSVFSLGFSVFFLNTTRGRITAGHEVLCGFEYIFKAMGLLFTVSLFTLLWGLLLVVPGIIAAIKYSQAFYILAEHPDYSVMKCIEESKKMMQPNKMAYFKMMISFAGWLILASIPVGAFEYVINDTGYRAYFDIIMIFLYLPLCPVEAYMNTACAQFYNVLTGKIELN